MIAIGIYCVTFVPLLYSFLFVTFFLFDFFFIYIDAGGVGTTPESVLQPYHYAHLDSSCEIPAEA